MVEKSKDDILFQKSYQNETTSTATNDQTLNELKTAETTNKLSRFKNIAGKYRLELIAFLFMISYVFPRITSTTMILDKVCLAHFKYPPYVCRNLANYTELKSPIERLATNYQLGHTLIQTVPAALLACFIGPWSDTYGRKFPVILALSGMALDTLGSTIAAYFLNSRVEYYYIPAFFSGISGGIVSQLAVVYSYASDLTPLNERTMKYAFLELTVGLSIPLGIAAGGWIYNFLGYPAVFLFSFSGIIVTLVCVLYLLPETRGTTKVVSWKVKLRDLFSFKTFKESFIATTKERPYNGRKQIVLLIISMCFIVVSINSTNDVNYLFVHHQFDWGNTKYSTVTASYTIFAVVLLLILVPIFKRIKISDAALGLIGTTSLLLKFTGIGISYTQGIYYVSNLLGVLSPCAPLAARSRISKVVPNDDIGKVFSFVAIAESLLPILTTILVSQIFNIFLTVFPGMPYVVLAVSLLVPFYVFSWLSCLPKLNFEDLAKKTNQKHETYKTIEP